MKCYCRTLYRLEWGNWIVGKNRQVISSSRFFYNTFLDIFIYSSFSFFPNTFQYPQRVYLQSLLLLNIPTFQPPILFPPLPPFFYYIHALPSWLFLWCQKPCTSLGTGFKEGEMGPLQVWLFKWSYWGFWGSAPGNWAKLGGWIEFSVTEAVSVILFTKLLNKIYFEIFIPRSVCDFGGRCLWASAGTEME